LIRIKDDPMVKRFAQQIRQPITITSSHFLKGLGEYFTTVSETILPTRTMYFARSKGSATRIKTEFRNPQYFVLANLAIAQPLFDLLSRTGFFIAKQ
jgi:hypothetical protein